MIHNTILQLALQLPGFSPDAMASPVPSLKPEFTDLASFLSPLLNIVFYVAVFFTFYMLVWAALQYIMSQGQKENLAKARSRITWALVGLVVVLLAYFITRYAGEILKPSGGIPF